MWEDLLKANGSCGVLGTGYQCGQLTAVRPGKVTAVRLRRSAGLPVEGWGFFTFSRDTKRKMIDLSAVDQMMNVFIFVINQKLL